MENLNAGDLSTERKVRFDAYHELHNIIKMQVPLCGLLCASRMMKHIDVVKLDDAMLAKHRGDYNWERESLGQFMTRYYGERAATLAKLLI